MPRKARKKVHPMPPLSPLDKLIYWLAMIITFTVSLAILFSGVIIPDQIAYRDQEVIAFAGHISYLWVFPASFYLMLVFAGLATVYKVKRYPLFGRRNFKYGPPAWPRVYPLFMKNKPSVYVSPKTKKLRKQLSIAIAAGALVSLITLPWAYHGGDRLRYNGSIAEYNMFNTKVGDYSSGQVSSVEIFTAKTGGGRRSRSKWNVGISLTTHDGQKYVFYLHEFRGRRVQQILNVKSQFPPEIISYSGADKLDRVISDRYLSSEEAALLYQLFNM